MGLHLQVLPLELVTFELVAATPGLEQQLLDGLVRSGMRKTNCVGCGCDLYTRGDDDRCPPCRSEPHAENA